MAAKLHRVLKKIVKILASKLLLEVKIDLDQTLNLYRGIELNPDLIVQWQLTHEKWNLETGSNFEIVWRNRA